MQLLLMCISTGLFLFYLLSVKFSQLSYISILQLLQEGGRVIQQVIEHRLGRRRGSEWMRMVIISLMVGIIVLAMLGSYRRNKRKVTFANIKQTLSQVSKKGII